MPKENEEDSDKSKTTKNATAKKAAKKASPKKKAAKKAAKKSAKKAAKKKRTAKKKVAAWKPDKLSSKNPVMQSRCKPEDREKMLRGVGANVAEGVHTLRSGSKKRPVHCYTPSQLRKALFSL